MTKPKWEQEFDAARQTKGHYCRECAFYKRGKPQELSTISWMPHYGQCFRDGSSLILRHELHGNSTACKQFMPKEE